MDKDCKKRVDALSARLRRLEASVSNLAKVVGLIRFESLPKRHIYTMGKAAKRR